MKPMSKNEELNLLDQMIEDTQRALEKDNRDRLYLEAELIQLIDERAELLCPECKAYVERRKVWQ